ncbi:hypothetical protein MNBD_ACTINO02-1560, partial [hydrothermal vent metagenome]
MSDTPDLVTGDRETPIVEPPVSVTEVDEGASRREVHDMWVAGTEEPEWVRTATDEGAQEMLPEGDDPAAAIQRGIAVDDDFVDSDDTDADQRQIINMGPQH